MVECIRQIRVGKKQARNQLEVTTVVWVRDGEGPGYGNFIFLYFCTKLLWLRRDVALLYRLDHWSANYCFSVFVNQV